MLYTELTITFQSCRDAFPSVILGNLILVRLLAWVVHHGKAAYTIYYFFIKFLLAAHGIQNHNCREQATTLPACCHKTSASSRRSKGSDAAAA